MISTARGSKRIRLLEVIFGYNDEHIHTDGLKYE